MIFLEIFALNLCNLGGIYWISTQKHMSVENKNLYKSLELDDLLYSCWILNDNELVETSPLE